MEKDDLVVCGCCKSLLSVDNFYKNSRTKNGLQNKCIDCFANYYKDNRRKIRRHQNKKSFENYYDDLETSRKIGKNKYYKNHERSKMLANERYHRKNPNARRNKKRKGIKNEVDIVAELNNQE